MIVSWSVIVIVSLPVAMRITLFEGYPGWSMSVIVSWSVIVIVSLLEAIENNFI